MQQIKEIDLRHLKRCNQIWEDMPIAEQGRICRQCKENIVDFRGMSRKEIATIHLLSQQRVCGLYDHKQISHVPQPQIHSTWTKRILAGVSGLLSVTNLSAQEETSALKTEVNIEVPDHLSKVDQDTSRILSQKALKSDTIFLSGKITNKLGEAIPFALVHVKGTGFAAQSDFNGNYHIAFPKKIDTLERIKLHYGNIGYESQSLILPPYPKTFMTHNVKLAEGIVSSFYVIEKPPFFKRIWLGIKRFFSN